MKRKIVFNRKSFNYFFYSSIAYGLVLLLFCGMIIVDRNIRKIAFNDYSSIIDFNIVDGNEHYFGVKIMGVSYTFNISTIYNATEFIRNIFIK